MITEKECLKSGVLDNRGETMIRNNKVKNNLLKNLLYKIKTTVVILSKFLATGCSNVARYAMLTSGLTERDK